MEKLFLPSLYYLRKILLVGIQLQSFHDMKDSMCTTPILSLHDFTKTFVLECDALGKGIDTILMQYDKPLTFTSKGIF
jgi:hypothetical protein